MSKLVEQDSRVSKAVTKLKSLIERPIYFVGDKSRDAWKRYGEYVEKNKVALRSGEEAVRFFTFFMPGRFGDSAEIGELIYGLSYVFGTINDRAIDDYREPTVYVGSNETLLVKNLKTIVSITQHLQIFIELLAIKNLTPKQRWKLVLIIESLKMCARLYLLYYFKGYMLIVANDDEMKHTSKLQEAQQHGRYRDLQSMYAEAGRDPHPHGHFSDTSQALQANAGHTEIRRHTQRPGQTRVSFSELFAEILYITRPVVYVYLFLKNNVSKTGPLDFGTKWRALIVAALMELYSHVLHMSKNNTTLRQRQELRRRQSQWIFFILLSPFFDKFIKAPGQSVEQYFKQKDASVRYYITSTLMTLLLAYQNNYFNVSGSNY